MTDGSDIQRESLYVRNCLDGVAYMIDGVRNNGIGYTTAVVTMTCNAAENALEAALASVRKAKSEARLITYQREQYNPAFANNRNVPPPRPARSLPAVVSPAAAE